MAEELVQPWVGEGAVALVVDVGAGGGWSTSTWNRAGVSGVGGAMTRCRSRAWKRYRIRPPAWLAMMAFRPTVQLPARAQWLRANRGGAT